MNYTDQTGRTITVHHIPERIVSLVPSQTELLCSLGLSDRLVGVTKFCVHPENIRNEKRIVGGTKQLHPETIREQQPDLIIANKEENTKEDIEALASDLPVWVSDVHTVQEALDMIHALGQLCGVADAAAELMQTIAEKRAAMHAISSTPARVLYLIWKDPYMSIGGDTFIHSMLTEAGYINCCASENRYPELDIPTIRDLQPELILLPGEPYPFGEKHKEALQQLAPKARLMLTDGEMWSWYGSRMATAFDYLAGHKKRVGGLPA
ncbi:MAG: helical backbone metal receptor [Chitinophagales bacterium]